MAKYNMNMRSKTLTISKNFERTAINNPNSEEFQIIERCRLLCPDLKVAYYSRKTSNSKRYGGLTYTKMENYIKLYENSNELLRMFSLVKDVAKVQRCKLGFVYNWFVKQFPDYEKMPEIRNGKLYTHVITVPEVEESELRAA